MSTICGTVKLCVIGVLAALAAVVILLGEARAAPKIGSPEACAAYADYALVAATFAKHKLSPAQTDAMLADIYTFSGESAEEMMALILRSTKAYVAGNNGTPRDYAQMFVDVCTSRRGNVDSILGVSS